MKTKMLVLLAAASGAFLLGGGAVLAGPVPPGPIGFHPTILADGTIARSTEVSANDIEFSSPANARVLVQTIAIDGGGISGWHTHPGLVVVTVTDGAVRVTNGCHAAVVYSTGQSFVEPPEEPGLVENASATLPAHTVATLIVPEGMVPRTNVFAPDCTRPEGD